METITDTTTYSMTEQSTTKTVRGYNIEQAKTAFVNALLSKDEANTLYWGYEIYYSNLKFEIFYLLNEIYNLFYVDKHYLYLNGYLQTLAKEWEASKRKNHTILGSIIKNLVELNISITDMVFNKTPYSNIRIIKHDNSLPDNFNPADYAGDPASFKLMTDDELVIIKRELKRAEKNEKKKRIIPSKVILPIYVCELLDIEINDETEYMSFVDWCNIHAKNSISKRVSLITRQIRLCNNR